MKTFKKSVSIILALVLMLSVFASAALTSNAAESSKSPVGARVTDEVKANWEKLKKYLSECTDQKYSYYNEDTSLAIAAETGARMSLSDNRVEFNYSFEGESREITLTILEVDINTTSTVKGYISNYKTYGSDQYWFWGDYSVGLENCNSPSEYTVSDAGGHTYAKNGVGLSPAPDYHATNEEYKEVFSDYAKEIEKLLLKPALNFTLENLGFGIPALPEPETTEPQTDSEETTAAETTEPQTVSEETTAPVETAEPQETTVSEETTAPTETAEPQETTVPAETTAPAETTEPQETAATVAQTKTFSYLPSVQQAMAGYNYKLGVQDDKGEAKSYAFTASDKLVDGMRVYTVEIPADTVITMLTYQVFDGDKWLSQVSASPAQAEGNIIKSDGKVYQASQPATKVTKKANTMTVKAKTVAAKAKKKTVIKKAKAFTIKNAVGKVTFAKVKGDKKITISKAGKITVKKGLKKGKTFKLKVMVTAAGNAKYNKKSKTVTVKIKIK